MRSSTSPLSRRQQVNALGLVSRSSGERMRKDTMEKANILSCRFRYVGKDPTLIGKTALGRWSKAGYPAFYVQVDQMGHPWSFGWHETNRHEWRYVKEGVS